MATDIIGPTLGVAQLAATLSGIPFAAGGVMVLQMINTACSQVSVHKVNDFWNIIVFFAKTIATLLVLVPVVSNSKDVHSWCSGVQCYSSSSTNSLPCWPALT